MLESLRRMLGKGTKSGAVAGLQSWADSKGFELKHLREGEGCVIQPGGGSQAGWRIEFGTPQRSYIATRELRMIAEVGTHKDLTALVLNRELMETMERAVFEQYVEDVQTRIDTETPPEMRWLVLFSKLHGSELGRLKDRFAAVCSTRPWAAQWLTGPLNDALAAAVVVTKSHTPVVLALARGRLTLRVEMPAPEAAALALWHSVFMHACDEARRVSRDWVDSPDSTSSTLPSTFPKPTDDE